MVQLHRVVLASLLIAMIVILAACAGSYTPPDDVLAEREAERYQAAQDWTRALRMIILATLSAVMLIIIILAVMLSAIGYRYQAAKAALREAEARRAHLVDIGGAILDLATDRLIQMPGQSIPMPLPTAARAQPMAQPDDENSLKRFIIEAAGIIGWDSDTIPRWNRWHEKGYEMTGAKWMQLTDELVELGLIQKLRGSETRVLNGTLRELYDELL